MQATEREFGKHDWRFWAVLAVGWFLGGVIFLTAVSMVGIATAFPAWLFWGVGFYLTVAAPAFAVWNALRLKKESEL